MRDNLDLEKYIPYEVFKNFKGKRDEEILFQTKKWYLNNIRELRGGPDFLRNISKSYDLNTDNVEKLAEKIDLNDVYLYFGYFLINKNLTYVFKANFKNSKDVKDEKLGKPIWGKDIRIDELKLWATKNNKDKIYLLFYSEDEQDTDLNPITQLVSSQPSYKIIFFIIHKDNGIIECIVKNSREEIPDTVDMIQKDYLITAFSQLSISENDLREFYRQIQEITHEIREGTTTTTSLRRIGVNFTKSDPVSQQIHLREFKELNGEFTLSTGNKTVVTLKRGNPGKVQFRSSLTFNERNEIFDRIRTLLGW